MAITVQGEAKIPVINEIIVVRNVKGLTLSVLAPEVHKWLIEQGHVFKRWQDGMGAVRAGWPSEGKVLFDVDECNTGFPPCLQHYNTGPEYMIRISECNLSILRHESAAVGPVKVTYSGLYSEEQGTKLYEVAQTSLAKLYREYMRETTMKATIKIFR